MADLPGFKPSSALEEHSTRYFVIRSNSAENVVKSVEHAVWATQRKNERKLNDAFRSGCIVILVFSVQRSGSFQGFARMRSPIGQAETRTDPFNGFGRTFDVEWLRVADLKSTETQHLPDGEELSHERGVRICRHYDIRLFQAEADSYEPITDTSFDREKASKLHDQILRSECVGAKMQRPQSQSEHGQKGKGRGKHKRCNNGGSHADLPVSTAKREIVVPSGDVSFRFPGTLTMFEPKAGHGLIKVDPGYVFSDGTAVPCEARVEAKELDTGGENPGVFENLAVELSLASPDGSWRVLHVTLPGGVPMTQAVLKNRLVVCEGRRFTGVVKFLHQTKGIGLIELDPPQILPPNVESSMCLRALHLKTLCGADFIIDRPMEELLYFQEADINASKSLAVCTQVSCKLYTEDNGAGACDIKPTDSVKE